MLDRQLNAILTILNDISDGAYKIIDTDDIISRLSDTDKCTKVELSGIIRTLADNEYIKVKYSTVDEYCLATLSKARAIEKPAERHEEQALRGDDVAAEPVTVRKDKKGRKDIRIDSVSVRKMVRRAAFFGALLGGLITSAIGLLIGVFLKMN